MSSKNKVLVQPINIIFKHLQTRSRVHIWLYDTLTHRLDGVIIGFDEFMNVVLDDVKEVYVKDTKTHKLGDTIVLGRLLLKGENITLIQQAP